VDGVGESSSANVALLVDPGFGVVMMNAEWRLGSWSWFWHLLIYGWFGIKLNQMGPPHMLHLTWFPWVDVICKSEIGGLGCTCRLGCSQIAVALLGAQLRLNYRPAGHHCCLYPTGLVSAKRVYQRDRDTWRQMVIGEYANVESSTKCLMPHQLNLLCQKVVG